MTTHKKISSVIMTATSNWQVQCPKCDTRYRVTDDLLKAARGMVRCSQCQEIFNATRHLKSPIQELSIPDKKKRKRNLFFFKEKKTVTNSNKQDKKSNLKEKLEQLKNDSHNYQPDKGRSYFRWFVIDLLFIGILIGQYVYFNFDELKKDSVWQPFLNTICAPLGCERSLLSYYKKQSTNSFVVDQFVVRSIAEHKDVLLVDAVIRNQTLEPKLFPRLKLIFTDKFGDTVSAKIVTPEEYLLNDSNNSQAVKPDIPVHLSFHIADPGVVAENYRLMLY